jgi:dTDP-4-amino-4,6-dideoxygalactose transaminase
MKRNQPIYVTKPFLPPLDEFIERLKYVWDSGILTHNGPLVQKLEKDLCDYFKFHDIVVVTNGTIAIQLAIKALDLKGEIITTPFTWIATASAIMWENCKPVFVDVQADTFNIDPDRIEASITEKTCAILGVHVFSNPCDVDKIKALADKHNLKVVYDAAHAMGVNYRGKSLLEYGDVSATSFHATKIFQTGEGGACVSENEEILTRIRRLRFFGHNENKEVADIGCNGKMTEIHAALGLVNLSWFDQVMRNRRAKYELYQKRLSKCDFIGFQKFPCESYNYSYMPVLFDNEKQLFEIIKKLNEKNVFPRRYFYPALNTVDAVSVYKRFPVAEDLAKRILCLPLYDSLGSEEIEYICELIGA